MRLSTCQSCIVTADDTVAEGSEEVGMTGSFDFKVLAFAAGSDADGDVVFVEVLDETGCTGHLGYVFKGFEKDLVAIF